MLQRLLAGTLLLLLATGTISAQDKARVLATTSFLADLAQNVAGELFEVESIMPIGGDPHIYEPVPDDAQRIVEADLIFMNGLTLEGWLVEMIENSGTDAPLITLSEGIDAIASAEYEDAYDPHAWMDVRNAMQYVRNISDALQSLRPSASGQIQANADAYLARLEALDAYIVEQIARIPPKNRVLITSHDAFRYYGRRYGLEVASAMGTSTEADVRTTDIRRLYDLIRRLGVPAIFVESTINPKLLRQIARDLGIIIGGTLFADSLGDPESGADTYEDMLRQNTDRLVRGLTQSAAVRDDEEEEAQGYGFILVILTVFALAFGFVAYRMRHPRVPQLGWKDYQLTVRGLTVSYDRKTALSNIYVEAKSGLITGLIGGNGSGKSTLFKAILGLVEPDAGTIVLNELPIDQLRTQIAYIPQREEIDWNFPATVLDVVMMGRYPQRGVFERLKPQDRARARDALRMLGIEALRDKQIGELSGGQQQRAFIARALVQDAEVYLLDEPFVGVDMTTEGRIMEILRDLAEAGKMVLVIHHDLAKAPEYFDELIMINQRIVAYGATEAVFTDENLRQTYGGRLTILQKTEGLSR